MYSHLGKMCLNHAQNYKCLAHLPFSRNRVFKQEVCAVCLLSIFFSLRGQQEDSVDIIGQGWGWCGGH